MECPQPNGLRKPSRSPWDCRSLPGGRSQWDCCNLQNHRHHPLAARMGIIWADRGQRSGNIGLDRPNFCSSKFGSKSTNIDNLGRNRPIAGRFGSNSGPIRPKLAWIGRIWDEFVQTWAKFDHDHPNLAGVDQIRTELLANSMTKAANIGTRKLSTLGPRLAKAGAKSANIGQQPRPTPRLGRVWAIFKQHRPSLA